MVSLLSTFPLLQLRKGEEEASAIPAAIPPVPSLSSGRLGTGDGGGPGNRRADIVRLGSYLSRLRFCSSMLLVDGARVCRGLLNPRRCVFPGGVGMAEMATAQWNKLFRPLLRPGDIPLRRHWRGCGNRPRSWLAAHRLQVMLLLLFFCKKAELSVGVVVAA